MISGSIRKQHTSRPVAASSIRIWVQISSKASASMPSGVFVRAERREAQALRGADIRGRFGRLVR